MREHKVYVIVDGTLTFVTDEGPPDGRAGHPPPARAGEGFRQGRFSNTVTWPGLSGVNGERSHPAQRSRRRKPVSLAIRSSSDGQTYR